MTLSLTGTVTTKEGTALQGAAVRLAGAPALLGGVSGALTVPPTGALAWSRQITGFTGTRWDAWTALVKDKVPGITWNEFIEQSLAHNPALAQDKNIFRATKSYLLPEQLPGGVEIVWTRPLTGFSGNRWQCWESYLKDKIEGLTFKEFAEAALLHNKALAADKNIFKAEKSYLLPTTQPTPLSYLLAWSDASGSYRFDLPTAGSYTLSVHSTGYESHEERLTVSGPTTRHVALSPSLVKVQPAPTATPQPATTTLDTKGFIQSSGGNFVLNGRPFRFVGANIRGLLHYGDTALFPYANTDHAAIQLEAAREMGARVVRVFLANRHTSTQETLNRLERALNQAEAYDMYLIVAFTDVHGDTGFNPAGDTKFYNQEGRLGKSFFEGGYRENLLPLVEQAVGRFKNHKRLFAWELGNELKAWEPGRMLPELFIEFARALSSRIRAIDPIHLIGAGIINSGNLGTTPQQAEQLYRLPTLDFLTAHIYYGVEDSGRDAGELENQRIEAARAEQDAELAQRLKKPFIIEEIGFCGGDRAGQTHQHLSKWYDQKGVSGCMQWGLMATDHDMGDGDRRFGMDRKFNAHDYGALLNVFKQRATAL